MTTSEVRSPPLHNFPCRSTAPLPKTENAKRRKGEITKGILRNQRREHSDRLRDFALSRSQSSFPSSLGRLVGRARRHGVHWKPRGSQNQPVSLEAPVRIQTRPAV